MRKIIDMKIRSIGIDLGKTTFHLVALGERDKKIAWAVLASGEPYRAATATT
jgi:hypothetical protein